MRYAVKAQMKKDAYILAIRATEDEAEQVMDEFSFGARPCEVITRTGALLKLNPRHIMFLGVEAVEDSARVGDIHPFA